MKVKMISQFRIGGRTFSNKFVMLCQKTTQTYLIHSTTKPGGYRYEEKDFFPHFWAINCTKFKLELVYG